MGRLTSSVDAVNKLVRDSTVDSLQAILDTLDGSLLPGDGGGKRPRGLRGEDGTGNDGSATRDGLDDEGHDEACVWKCRSRVY